MIKTIHLSVLLLFVMVLPARAAMTYDRSGTVNENYFNMTYFNLSGYEDIESYTLTLRYSNTGSDQENWWVTPGGLLYIAKTLEGLNSFTAYMGCDLFTSFEILADYVDYELIQTDGTYVEQTITIDAGLNDAVSAVYSDVSTRLDNFIAGLTPEERSAFSFHIYGFGDEYGIGNVDELLASVFDPQLFESIEESGWFGLGFADTYTDTLNNFELEWATLEVNPVPVPGAVWLLGSGLLGVVGIRRRMR